MKTQFEKIKNIYSTRNIEEIESLVDMLYRKRKLPIFIGTSNAEIYFEREQIIKLFKNDLESWGDVSIDLDSLKTTSYGPYKVTHCSASVKQTFDIDEQTYIRFVSILDDIKNDIHGTLYQKAQLIQQLLVHLMHDRKPGKREYLWDLDLDVISKNEAFVMLQFSIPVDLMIPDVRLDDFDPYNKEVYLKELDMIKKYANNENHLGLLDEIEKQVKTKQKAEQVFLDLQHIVIDEENDFISFVAIGSYEKRLTLDQRLESLFDHFHQEQKPKDQLFKIRRDIAQHLLHDAIGEQMQVHFRTIGIAEKIKNQYQIHYLQITLPFNLILEQKTDHETML